MSVSVSADAHAARFERERGRLFGVAYRMLGSAAEAEDVLQDASVRWSEHTEPVDSARAFLTTVVVRLCLDAQKSARARRETYVGPWLPEPLLAHETPPSGPDARAELAESLSLAFLVLLERLSPLERAAFLLREVFNEPYDAVAQTLGTSEAACRQLVRRARAHVDANRPRFVADDAKKQALLAEFVRACASGDSAALGRVLASDVTLHSDGGGKVTAARRPVLGSDQVARFLLGVIAKAPPTEAPELVRINGEPGVLLRREAGATAVGITTDGRVITNIWLVLNPDKLTPALARLGH